MRQGFVWNTQDWLRKHTPLTFTLLTRYTRYTLHLNPGSHHRYLAGLKLWLSSGSYHTHDGSVMENSWGKADSLIHNPQSLHPNEGMERETFRKEAHTLDTSSLEIIRAHQPAIAGNERFSVVVSPVELPRDCFGLRFTKRAQQNKQSRLGDSRLKTHMFTSLGQRFSLIPHLDSFHI